MSVNQTVSTLLQPTTSCPRCDGEGIIPLPIAIESQFAWHECHECDYLWAIPHGWTPHAEPSLRPSTK